MQHKVSWVFLLSLTSFSSPVAPIQVNPEIASIKVDQAGQSQVEPSWSFGNVGTSSNASPNARGDVRKEKSANTIAQVTDMQTEGVIAETLDPAKEAKQQKSLRKASDERKDEAADDSGTFETALELL